jgi:hypothetical protein
MSPVRGYFGRPCSIGQAFLNGYSSGFLSLKIRQAIQDQRRALVMSQEEVVARTGISHFQFASALHGRYGLSLIVASCPVQWL